MAWTFYDAAGNNGTVQLGTLGISSGGTGAITAAAALEALGVGVTDSPTFVDLTLTDDLLLTSSGAVINFNSGDMTITHSSNVLTIAGGTFTTAALTATTIQGTQIDITAQGDLRLQDNTGGQYIGLDAPATVSTSYVLTLPAAVPAAGNALKITSYSGGSAVAEWGSAGVSLGLVIALGG
jgi:hypothetical protein